MATESPDYRAGAEAERYARVLRLAGALSFAFDWTQLALCATQAFPAEGPVGARIWVHGPHDLTELGSHSPPGGLCSRRPEVLSQAMAAAEPTRLDDGAILVPLRAVGVLPMLLELEGVPDHDLDLVEEIARVVALRAAGLALADPQGRVLPALRGTEETGRAMRNFSGVLQRLLPHDRLTIFLLTAGDRAVERFATAGAIPLPDEELFIAISDFGLRDCLLRDEPLLTGDLSRGRAPESRGARLLAQAGFRSGLNVPLHHAGQAIGILQLLSRTPNYYGEHDIRIAQDVADQVAPFVDHMRRQESVRPAALREAIETERSRLAHRIGTVLRGSLADAQDELARVVNNPSLEPFARQQSERLVGLREELIAAVADAVPPPLRSRPFEQLLSESVRSFASRHDIRIHLRLDGHIAGAAMSGRRMTLGALRAALDTSRAAGASDISVLVSVDDDILLRVTDDGRPGRRDHEIEAAAPHELPTIAECARALGGRVYAQGGQTLLLELPRRQPVRRDIDDERWLAHLPEDEEAVRPHRVYVLDAQGVRRAGFTHFLDAQQEFRIVGHAADVGEARRSIEWLQPDVVFLDAEADAASAIVSEVLEVSPSSVVIGLASRAGKAMVDELLTAGAAGVLPQDLERAVLLDKVGRLVRGEPFDVQEEQLAASTGTALNSREWAVLKLIVEGHTNSEIGARLYLAPKSIERYVASATRKVGARNRSHLVALALGRGLVRAPME